MVDCMVVCEDRGRMHQIYFWTTMVRFGIVEEIGIGMELADVEKRFCTSVRLNTCGGALWEDIDVRYLPPLLILMAHYVITCSSWNPNSRPSKLST
jgi:hypothetical protein